MPESFWKRTKVGCKAWRMMPDDGSASRRKEREHHRCRQPRNQCPPENPARAEHPNQCSGAERPQHVAKRVHRALEAECATLVVRRDGIRKQRIARWPA